MKFLCVSCNEAMKLREVSPPERGSLTVVYRCPSCAHEFAMLTNPAETQVVGSLGVKVGGGSSEAVAESKCPFAGMVQGVTEGRVDANVELPWTTDASSRLDRIPEFVRPMAKIGIEKFAKERGLTRVDAQVLDQAKDFFGM